jgi:hypothetical protein
MRLSKEFLSPKHMVAAAAVVASVAFLAYFSARGLFINTISQCATRLYKTLSFCAREDAGAGGEALTERDW